MKKLVSTIFLTIFIIIMSVSITLPIKAADISDSFNKTGTSTFSQTVNEAGYFANDSNNINTLIQNIISAVLSFLGVIFIILIIYAGFKWMTAHGNQEEVTKAKDKLKNAIIGLIIVLAAYAISVAVFSFFINTSPTLEY